MVGWLIMVDYDPLDLGWYWYDCFFKFNSMDVDGLLIMVSSIILGWYS